ncbi:MAG TPA: cyanophycinase [Phycisphaerae bacterium]|jgi:cyanophycinase
MSMCLASLVLSALCLAANPPARGYICAEGGGSIRGGTWASSVFHWMTEKGRFGSVAILGTAPPDAELEQVFLREGAACVSSLAITRGNADDPAIYHDIAVANVVWIRGGDQSRYVNFWNDTLTERAIQHVYRSGGVVGGTSAGCAVLGDVIYDARVASLAPRQALRDAYHPNLTLTSDFLNLTPDVLFDTHFTERGRLGRLVVMLARCFADLHRDVLGIGVDHRTAFCIAPDLIAEVRGEGSVTILQRTAATQQIVERGSPPVVTDLRYTQLIEGYRYDLTRREILARPASARNVPESDDQLSFQAARINGDQRADAAKGDVQVIDDGDKDALTAGRLKLTDGEHLLHRTIISTQTWQGDFVENRVGGPQYALARHPHFLGLYLDEGVGICTAAPALLSVEAATEPQSALIILDTAGMTRAAFATAHSQRDNANPRQSVGIESAVLHVLRAGWQFNAAAHAVIGPPPAPE